MHVYWRSITDIQAAHASQMKSGAALWGEGMFEN